MQELTEKFLKDFNEFKQYLSGLERVKVIDEDTLIYDFGKRVGKVAFYVPYVELTIEEDGKNIFLLQTELISKTQIDEYMKSFFDCLQSREDRLDLLGKGLDNINILFVCSCGATSKIIANKCLEKAKELGITLHFDACSVEKLNDVQKNYDRIFFLPQISYVLRRQDFEYKDKIKVLPTAFVAHLDIESIFSYVTSAEL